VILDGLGSVLTNAGVINAQGSGASLFVRDGGTTTVTNSGTMTGIVAGVWNKFGSGTLSFTNTGTVESPNFAFLGGLGSDNLINMGTMLGTVSLGDGNDAFDGRGGHVEGNILGGTGDDRFILGSSAEAIDGGYGDDALDFSGRTARIWFNLEDTAANKAIVVKGDTFTSIEILIGTNYRDTLTGDAMNNTLLGGRKTDVLNGGAGDDVLEGGTGKDVLTGGAGGDVFVLHAYNERADVITDFDANMDHILLEGSAFGLGLFEGAVDDADFIVSATNATLDATDRFVFRTTDQTLWYDADGMGGVASVLVYDLQADATLNAGQLLII
jgi:Ca2+-binding RTX toxin-like protein